MIDAIDELDLDPIKIKLMHPTDGKGWSRDKAEAVALQYRRFLKMNRDHRAGAEAAPIVPTKDVDAFWHYHILDTMKYAEDCQGVFGRFLHHFPYFGLRGAEDARNLADAFAATQVRYHQSFGEEMPAPDSADCQGAGCGSVVCNASECNGEGVSLSTQARPRFTSPYEAAELHCIN
jgi:hypothetical protein